MSIALKDLSQGSRIAYIRKIRGITQSELGIRCGFDATNASTRVSQYERNCKCPKPDTIDKMAEVLYVEPIILRYYDFTSVEDLNCFRKWIKIADDPHNIEAIQKLIPDITDMK